MPKPASNCSVKGRKPYESLLGAREGIAMAHVVPDSVNLEVLGPRCMPGQFGTEADKQYPVVLVSPVGAFGVKPANPRIDLVSNKRPNSPGSMDVVGDAAWTPCAIVAMFPATNPGNGADDEEFTIVVHAGTEQRIEHVFVTGPAGSGWPPTHPPTHAAAQEGTRKEPVNN
jgi:hypothetical protein